MRKENEQKAQKRRQGAPAPVHELNEEETDAEVNRSQPQQQLNDDST